MPSRRNRSGKKCKRGGMNFFGLFGQTPEEKIKKGLDDAYNGLDPVYTILEHPENAKFKKTKENIYVTLNNIKNALEEFKTENVIEGEVSVNTDSTTGNATDPPSSPSPPSPPSPPYVPSATGNATDPPSQPPTAVPTGPTTGGKKKSMKGGKKLKKTKTKRRR